MSYIYVQPYQTNQQNIYKSKKSALKDTFPLLQIPCPLVDNQNITNISKQYTNCLLPKGNRNYTIVDKNKVDYFVSQKEASLPYLADILSHSNNEEQIVETLNILNSMLDNGVKGIDKMYPILSRFNNTNSPNIQTFLAGIYRKTQVPDAFGPLVKMLIQNSLNPQTSNFDPNEEIGGAILSYISDRFRNQQQK